MSERKVLNKYFPPDFDPALIPRRKIEKDAQQKVRLMTPFSMRCNTCGEYIYKGKKFNARKETTNETYHSIKIFRFYIRCNRCAAEITFKTDPANTDYVAENGAQRNFEPWRDEDADKVAEREREEEEQNNPMKALEHRTQDSKREMEIMDALDEIRTRNAMNERLDADAVLNKIWSGDVDNTLQKKQQEDEEDDRLAKQVFKDVDGESVKRLWDNDQDLLNDSGELDATKVARAKFSQSLALPDFSTPLTKKRKQGGSLGLVKNIVSTSKATPAASSSSSLSPSSPSSSSSSPLALATKNSSSPSVPSTPSNTAAKQASKPASLLSLVGSYGSDSESDAD
ncbi:hypothetical protein BX616_002924 [Lobosporangium transversale]|uniref:Splicing factor YJU2 n=1 Tax=Lobosporangium transversale TaxID=64571 RepID=A0A1Y2GC43_9FUNG|nr:CWC16 protein [Lobosporangium transversale]KAF9899620.1 hypothetical protein BX616_002924 [Lobosporangium transversale]ORZ06758.1 CWC16 protein [Lobosporangium transversale]|eukprot:XP_021877679.1 CWC16 protein [Lobosporangium transversale]